MSNAGNSMLKYFYKRWHICCLLFFLSACQQKNSGYNKLIYTHADSVKEEQRIDRALQQIVRSEILIKTGDLILRTGNDFTSESLRQLNQRDKTYSHCGIASIEHDSIFVYHALGGEFNPDQKIRRDPFLLFSEPFSNRGIGIYRYDLTANQTTQLLVNAKTFYTNETPFDMKFDLATDDRLYCAEFVYKSLRKIDSSRLPFNISKIKDFQFIGVDDLFMQPMCKPVKKLVYK